MRTVRKWVGGGLLTASFFLAGTGTASAATALVAAYEKYVPGQGFDIGLIDTGSGQAIAVPPGVNTTADELHPALTPDGRFLAFTRMTLVPQLNGNVVPPEQRSVIVIDREGQAAQQQISGGAGPTWMRNELAFGLRPRADSNQTVGLVVYSGATGPRFDRRSDTRPAGTVPSSFDPPAGSVVDLVSALHFSYVGSTAASAFTVIAFDQVTGATLRSQAVADDFTRNSAGGVINAEFDGSPASAHPVMRGSDRYMAFDQATAPDGEAPADLKSLLFGAQATPDDAPAPINTVDDERMPSWSPSETKLAFVRTTASGPRKLLLFDLTPGLQTVVNDGLSLGAVAPTPQLRRFQNVWGGISLAEEERPGAVGLACRVICLGALSSVVVGGPGGTLMPAASGKSAKKGGVPFNIGIIVARVVGTRRVLGRKVPRIAPVGRVPLGRAKIGTNAFRWDGRVGGKKLKPGSYVLTFRALSRKGRVLSTTQSIRFRVRKSGRISGVRSVKL